jgi:hypothetical protein
MWKTWEKANQNQTKRGAGKMIGPRLRWVSFKRDLQKQIGCGRGERLWWRLCFFKLQRTPTQHVNMKKKNALRQPKEGKKIQIHS